MRLIPPRRASRCAVLAIVPALAAAPAPASAQLRATRLSLDNDAYDFWIPVAARPDWDYTNGVELSAELAGGPLWARGLAPRSPPCAGAETPDTACATTTLAFGQKLFTPRVDSTAPVPGERPYAGWLYLSATGRVATAARQRSVAVEAGVTGPPSLGKAVHTGWHRLAGFRPPLGWDNQLRFQPGIVVRYEESLVASARAGGVRIAALAPAWGADAGNVHVSAHAGVSLRAGWAVPHPWSRAADRDAGPVSLYAIAAVRGDAVARDLFLDGSGGSPRVEREPFVAQHEVGAGARVRGATLEFRAVTQGRQYRTAPGSHAWSTIELSYRVR